jgi:hypothetical protein
MEPNFVPWHLYHTILVYILSRCREETCYNKNHPFVASPGYRAHGLEPTFAYKRVISLLLFYAESYLLSMPVMPLCQFKLLPHRRAARRLLDARGQGPQVAAWEAELNALVYQVYGLSAAEIGVVEGR